MAFATKIKVKKSADGHEVLCLVKHPMETGLRKDSKTGEMIPAHYIEIMTFKMTIKLVVIPYPLSIRCPGIVSSRIFGVAQSKTPLPNPKMNLPMFMIVLSKMSESPDPRIEIRLNHSTIFLLPLPMSGPPIIAPIASPAIEDDVRIVL